MLKLRCVVSTDLLSRGVDLPDVQVVINLDLPIGRQGASPEVAKAHRWAELVHRIGRAGRFGSEALAINFVSEGDLRAFPEQLAQIPELSIEELTGLVTAQLTVKSSE